MDWITQNKYAKWLLIVLLLVNIITITIIWVIISRDKPMPPFNTAGKPPAIKDLMQKELNLTNEQSQKFEKLRQDNFLKVDALFKSVAEKQKLLSDELSSTKSNDAKVDSIINDIMVLQGKLEKERFNHFKELISICTSDQQKKLMPILKQFYSFKPMDKNGNPKEMKNNERGGEMPPPPFEERQKEPGQEPFGSRPQGGHKLN